MLANIPLFSMNDITYHNHLASMDEAVEINYYTHRRPIAYDLGVYYTQFHFNIHSIHTQKIQLKYCQEEILLHRTIDNTIPEIQRRRMQTNPPYTTNNMDHQYIENIYTSKTIEMK